VVPGRAPADAQAREVPVENKLTQVTPARNP
jgi:hypothetical protein